MKRHAVQLMVCCVLLSAGLVAGLAGRTHAQAADWELAQTPDGTLYLLHEGIAQQVVPDQVPDEVVAAFLQGAPIENGQLPVPELTITIPTPIPLPPLAFTPEPTLPPVVIPTPAPYPTLLVPSPPPLPTDIVPTPVPFPTFPPPIVPGP